MSIYLRGKIWWCRIQKYGRAWQSSLKTKDRVEAMMLATDLARSLRRKDFGNQKPLKSRGGLTYDDVQVWKDAQKGRCRICKKKEDRLCVDHCHASNKVRGLLCYRCNTGLGQFKDSPGLLRQAAEYLERTKTAK